MNAVPFFDLRRQYVELQEEIEKALLDAARGTHYILGPTVAAFEAEMARLVGVPAAVGVSSGSDALLVALMALGIGPGDEVVTTPFSFFATLGAILRIGARPVFADIEPDSFNLDPAQALAAVTAHTKAVLPVHLFGRTADLAPLEEPLAARGVALVEDAAQAIGAAFPDGRLAGSAGVAGCFSFFPTKNVGALGDGGLVTTRDIALAERVRCLRAHGASPKYVHPYLGGNFRLDALQAAVLHVKAAHLARFTERRRANAAAYRERLQDGAAVREGLVRLPAEGAGRHVYHQFVIRAERRDALRRALQEQGIGSEVYYPTTLSRQPVLAALGYAPQDFPEATRAAASVLALPIFPELTREEIARVAAAIEQFYRTSVSA